MCIRDRLKGARAYLELHIEQGPVLEASGESAAAVLGTVGVERRAAVFSGRASHAGATPMDMRQDSFLAAARAALLIRDVGVAHEGGYCTTGGASSDPGVVTAVAGRTELLLDQRHLEADGLAAMVAEAREAGARIAREEGVEHEWERVWAIEPIHFHPELIDLGESAVHEVAGEAPKLPSGPLHDAAEAARAGVPAVMLFVQSLRGLSHAKEEDTRPEHLEQAVEALDRLTTKTLEWVSLREA